VGSASISPAAERTEARIPYRTLGRTGERVSAIGLGGFHLGKPELSEAQAIRIIRTAIDAGLNFLDNSWDYNRGASERRMGKALEGGYRARAFLMTKIDGQTKEAAAAQIDESLRRLRTDVVDLLQFHEIIRMEDPDRIFAEGGALEAALEARDEGRIRFIGFTGHKSPAIHRKMLETAASHRFRFDTVQMPLNVMDAHFQSFEKEVLPILVKEEIGVLGMKPLGDRQVPSSRTVGAVEALHYAMNLPTSVVITGCDSLERLEQALHAARTFRPMTPDEVKALLDKTASAAKEGRFERYKTTHDFDSTVAHPEWLG
jgi:aryl-alcohol dehydrogenase-like predicted oxidoreductase